MKGHSIRLHADLSKIISNYHLILFIEHWMILELANYHLILFIDNWMILELAILVQMKLFFFF